ncbi:MAG: UDP-N-acetylmuramyl-tripeptide synthetase [Treponema sp.]|jgi:UDP-N-acetylmuramoyl-L-alanyl-D-glutamate--2,6-diaminopimelate ligase|nr:UDP-N-acetylmuramyl-tripeptide synthetase [Treponema sp.]
MVSQLSAFFSPRTAQAAGCVEGPGQRDPLVTGLALDSRKVQPGNLFFALKGIHTDGRRYIDEALRRGALVIVHEGDLPVRDPRAVYLRVKNARTAMSPIAASFYGHPAQRMVCIGVTGTEGKSTTVYLIWQLLRLMGKRAGFFSTVLSSNGGEALPNPEHQTTPEAPEVQRLLWEMAENGAEYAVLEASSHGLSQKTGRLRDIKFSAAVMTNVTHEHLEFHGTWEQYRDDKLNLFRALKQRELLSSVGVVNADDPSAAVFSAVGAAKMLTYSVRGLAADLSLGSMVPGAGGNWYNAVIRQTGEIIDIRDQLPGTFNAGNVFASLLVVSELLDIPLRETAPLAARLKPLLGRMTSVPNSLGLEILVDYAHTPSSFRAVFPPLRDRLDREQGPGAAGKKRKERRLIAIFGSAGERDIQKRYMQGEIAASYADILILCDEDPRGEDPLSILEEIAAGCMEGNIKLRRGRDLFLIADRPAAIRKALSLASPGDLVLFLGKGHENSIIYADGPRPYDEIDAIKKAAAELQST